MSKRTYAEIMAAKRGGPTGAWQRDDDRPDPATRVTAETAFAGADWEALHWPFGTKPKDRPYATHKALIMYRDRRLIALKLSDGTHEWFVRRADEPKLPPGMTL